MSNSNDRGSTSDRRARKLWLLSKFGDGVKASCWECGCTVDIETIVPDRIVPKVDGGTYRRDNLRPHCLPCSHRSGPRIRDERKPPQTVCARGHPLTEDNLYWTTGKRQQWQCRRCLRQYRQNYRKRLRERRSG